MMRRSMAVVLAAGLALAVSGCSGGEAAQEPLEVGIAQIVAHPSLDALHDGFIEGMAEGGWSTKLGNVAYETQNAQGDPSTLSLIANSFQDKDLVVAIATPTAQTMAQVITDKPIFFAGVTDPVGAQLVASLEKPGGNLTGTSDMPPIADQLRLITEIMPEARTIGLVYSSSETNSEIQAGMVREAAPALGLTIREVTVINSSEVQQAAESVTDVDAFFVGTDNTIVSAIESLVQVGEKNKIPVFVSDPDSIKRGAVAAYAVDYLQQGIQTGRMAARMLAEGTSPADIPVEVAQDLELSVNPAAAARMGLTIPEAVLARADITVE